jgi:RNA polymerase sigma-70 factor (ECF subfamily)
MRDPAEHERMTAFCRREHPRLVGALTLQTGDRGAAEELAQETLIRACQHWPKVSQMAAPRAWLHKVALNQARSWGRRRAAERRARARHDARPVEHRDTTESADRLAVRAALRDLPERQRMAVVLRYYADLPAAEVASVMGCSEGTVRALTHQAITRLRGSSGLLDDDPLRGLAAADRTPHEEGITDAR